MRVQQQSEDGSATPAPPAAASSVRRRAAEVVAEQQLRMFAQVASAVEGSDPEGVHDMRVATRRLRACLRVFAPWLDAGDFARLEPAVRGLTRALGRVRELDVLRLRLAEFTAQGTAERLLAIEHVDARLVRRRRRARARMMARFAKVDLDRLQHRLHGLVEQLGSHLADVMQEMPPLPSPAEPHEASPLPIEGPGTILDDQPIVALLEALGTTLVGEARAISHPDVPAEVGTQLAAEALHAVRIAAKKLRYQLEIVVPYLGEAGEDAVKRLRGLQDKLGDFHDDTVLDDTLGAAIARATERSQPRLASELRAFRVARRRALLRDERAVRAAIVKLRDADFVALVVRALGAAGVVVPAPAPHPAPEVEPAPAAAAEAPAASEARAKPVRRTRARARSAAAAATDAAPDSTTEPSTTR